MFYQCNLEEGLMLNFTESVSSSLLTNTARSKTYTVHYTLQYAIQAAFLLLQCNSNDTMVYDL